MLAGAKFAQRGVRRCGAAGGRRLRLATAAQPPASAGIRTSATDDSAAPAALASSAAIARGAAARFAASTSTSRSSSSSSSSSRRRFGGPATALSVGGRGPPARAMSTDGKKLIPFVLADIGEGIAEVELLQWFVSEGDSVHQFDNICEVQSDKATVEISSRYDGVVKNLHFTVGDMVQVGSALVDIEIAADDGDDEAAPAAVEPAAETLVPAAAAASATAAAPAEAASPSAPKREILTTPAVRKIARENSLDLSTITGTGPNGRILKEDVLAVLSGEAPAPVAPPPASSAAAPAATTTPTPAPTSAKALPTRGAMASGASRTEPISGASTVLPDYALKPLIPFPPAPRNTPRLILISDLLPTAPPKKRQRRQQHTQVSNASWCEA